MRRTPPPPRATERLESLGFDRSDQHDVNVRSQTSATDALRRSAAFVRRVPNEHARPLST
ncbi:MAG TPA: hypothetical protein DCQ98_20460 [Planctomycetaceae bacterium]|nr:hypothetical protein [Planctomycetaceae bacterium]